jgi:hypothetical protein
VVSVKIYILYEKINSICKNLKISDRYLYWTVPLIFGIWTLPSPIIFPNSGLDSSWIVGLNLAFVNNFQFGKDIIFTFGPLGFLWMPVLLDYNLWTLSLLFTLIIHFLFIACVFYVIKTTFRKINYHFMLIPILIFAIPYPYSFEYQLLIIASLMSYLILTDSISLKKSPYILLFIGLLLSIATLIKFTAFFISISIIIMFFFCCILMKKNSKYGIYLFVFYITFLISIWFFAGQDTTNLVSYLYSGMDISNGYTDAMVVYGPQWQVFLGITSLCIYLLAIIFSVKELNKNIVTFLLLNVGILFVAFKHGFIRHDGHQLIFFQICLLLFLFLSILVYSYGSDKKLKYLNFVNILFIFFVLLSIYSFVPELLKDNIMIKQQDYVLSEQMIGNPELLEEQVKYHEAIIRDNYRLDEVTIKYLENKTVDIFPWDISMAWAYNLEWTPRPIFQSYSAYTQYLDEKNSLHFVGNEAPDIILYTSNSIDGRYPIFDEPGTFRNILFNYRYQNSSGNWIILNHSKDTNLSNQVEYLGTTEIKVGEIAEIPNYDGYIFGYLTFDYNLFGKIMKILYKPSPANIKFVLKNGEVTQEFRFIPGPAKNGLFLSQYIESNEKLASLFRGELEDNITGVVINTSAPNYYSKNIKITFIGIPKNAFI